MIEIPHAIETGAETLFQQNTLHDITDLSQSLGEAARSKHEELRTLVASQYRDLLKTADQIIHMNELAKKSDKELYELSFMSNGKLSNIMTIERNIDIMYGTSTADDGSAAYGESVSMGRSTYVAQKADLFLEMSKLLNLSADDGVDEIITVLTHLPMGSKWFVQNKSIVDEKLQELEMVMVMKVKAMSSLDELVKVDLFVTTSEWFDKEKFHALVYESLLNNTITLENLSLVLAKFPKFNNQLQSHYTLQMDTSLTELNGLLSTIDEAQPSEDQLNLYSLKMDDDVDYLQKIKFLTNGLIYGKYQDISIKIDSLLNMLQFIQQINNNTLYLEFKSKCQQSVQLFKQHALKQDNKLLVEYLSKLVY